MVLSLGKYSAGLMLWSVSPSVYVVFHSIFASNLCAYAGPCVQSATLAYDPHDLSSRVPYGSKWNGFISHRRMNFADFGRCSTNFLYT